VLKEGEEKSNHLKYTRGNVTNLKAQSILFSLRKILHQGILLYQSIFCPGRSSMRQLQPPPNF